MTQAMNVAYAHRHNRDGSIDSICKTCFATVARVQDAGTLTEHERTHCCSSWISAPSGSLMPTESSSALTLVPPQNHTTRERNLDQANNPASADYPDIA